MATITTARRYTAEEFQKLPPPRDGSKQELVRGEIVITPPAGFRHGKCQLIVDSLLIQHVRTHQLGQVTVASGLITERNPDSAWASTILRK